MEHITLNPSAVFPNSCYYDEAKNIRFDPPVYEQRYCAVLRLLELDFWKESFKKIVEFGCAEMKFFRLLRSLPAAETILEVDIDDDILQKCRHLVRPLLADYLAPSTKSLSVEVWRGNIAEPHECLLDTDVVIGIEIIEHLHQPVLEKVPENVFGYIKPKVAMFSTPNVEYNVLFDGLLENGFRHDDHKFEWTRAQFEEWASSICKRYPNYSVKFFGIGPPPPGRESIGFVSQLAVFVHQDFLHSLPEPAVTEAEAGQETSQSEQPEDTATPHTDVNPRSQLMFDEEIGEVVFMEPPQNSAEVNGSDDAVPPPMVEDCLHGADDVSNDGRWREYEDVNDELDQELSDDDDDEDAFGGLVIPEAEMRDMRTRNDSGNFEGDDLPPLGEEYWMITCEVYPVAPLDERSRDERIKHAAEYQLRRLRNFGDDFLAPEQDRFIIPLQVVLDCMVSDPASIEELRACLRNAGYQIDDEDVLTLPVEEESSDEDRVDDDAEYDVDEHVQWDSDEEPPPGMVVEGMALQDYDETWD
ncbi:uncharacterized protein LOC128724813 [Anopheles nili]|uniref:uncharacterized protein LOC128724813 n=1 Tax=Anopheles nili TaxID=185578 RepID=UPI00237A6DEB|nr:uncharacterized protein LOC128724813 [Anopheles nili]